MDTYAEFLKNTNDKDPVLKQVRALVKREIKRLERSRLNKGRPALEDTPERLKWREYQRNYRASRKQALTK